MKNEISHEEIDELIRKSLSEEEAAYYSQLDEQGMFGQMKGLFTGKMKWWHILFTVISLILVAIVFYCLYQFLNASSTNDLIKWATGMFAALIMQAMMKLYSWNQMDKNAIMREMKRLEFQISLINHGHKHD